MTTLTSRRLKKLEQENEILRAGLISMRFYLEHMKNEAEYDPEWMGATTQHGMHNIDEILLKANKASGL